MNYGLIGEKLGHSFSAQIHDQLFGYAYELKELAPSELEPFLRKRSFKAINVTAPYKEAVIPFLDVIDEVAHQIGAVNTIVHRDGKLCGYNTDFDGLLGMIERSGMTIRGKKVLILGSGGTSKTAMAVVRQMGCASIYRVSRTAKEGCITYADAQTIHADAQILINATPCGMYPHSGNSPISLESFSRLEGVVDVIYNPLRTKLVCDALKLGVPAVNGLFMLVKQAASAAEYFVNRKVSQDKIESIYYHLLSAKQNIVLVGMPGCGKSTIGRRLAEMLQRPFVDTDDLIEQRAGRSIKDLFLEIGEHGFRDYESAVISDAATLQGAVIATGGGAVLRAENVQKLQENGYIYFLDRSLSLLDPSIDRPLSSNASDLQKRYDERYPIYNAACDMRIMADKDPEEVANTIREDYCNENLGN